MRRFLPLLALLLAASSGRSDDREARAKAVFVRHCRACHGQDGSVEGGMNYVAEPRTLVARRKVTPGDAAKSAVYRRMADGSMPPGDGPRPDAAELAAVREWIEHGATVSAGLEVPPATSPAETMLADLETLDRRTRRFQRYFTLTHLAQGNASPDQLQTHRHALAKLLNSLSWHSKITNPVAIDPAGMVLRIDLRWYAWDATTWNRIAADYPYGTLGESLPERAVLVATASRLPAVRVDWFTATASVAPLYYDLLQLPQNLPELEAKLRVDAAADIRQDRVVRVGFNGSGVSRFNRLLERHDAAHGMYWRSYDFDEPPANLIERANGVQLPDRRNLFAFPLGPSQVESPFQHAGGEVIFALPNGLHGYMLVRADNTRLDKGPAAIVSDPRRPDRAVTAGVSCMSCHRTGILPKADQVRDYLAKNPKAYPPADAELVRALYPDKDVSLRLMAEDARRYTEAVARTGAKVGGTEAVSAMTARYEADLDLAAAAGELGLPAGEFRRGAAGSEALTRHFGGLLAGGTVTRALWVQTFADAARELTGRAAFQANQGGALTADGTGEADPLDGRADRAHAADLSADGRRALFAGADRTLRLWDVEAKRDLKRMGGHTAAVLAVALHPDGARAVSAANDGTVRIWDLRGGTETTKFAGPPGLVTGVGVTADGATVVACGYDGTVVAWDLATGKRRFRLDTKYPRLSTMAVHPREPIVAVAWGGKVTTLDAAAGAPGESWQAHDTPVRVARFAPDGRSLLTADTHGKLRSWSLPGHRLDVEWTAPGVTALAHDTSGRTLVAAETGLRVFDPAGRELSVSRKHTAPVLAAIFTPSGTATVSLDANFGTVISPVAEPTARAVRVPPEFIAPAKP